MYEHNRDHHWHIIAGHIGGNRTWPCKISRMEWYEAYREFNLLLTFLWRNCDSLLPCRSVWTESSCVVPIISFSLTQFLTILKLTFRRGFGFCRFADHFLLSCSFFALLFLWKDKTTRWQWNNGAFPPMLNRPHLPDRCDSNPDIFRFEIRGMWVALILGVCKCFQN
jgi:hypothetical protein